MGKFLIGFLFVWAGGVAGAESGIVGVATEGDWTVYETVAAPKECGIISRPKNTVNSRGGKPVQGVKRADILLAIMIDEAGQAGVSFEGGYPFDGSAGVTLSVDGETFDFITVDSEERAEFAWPKPEDDERVIDAMKRGNEAIAVGTSQRGTRTRDSFSLRGVQAGLKAAVARCKQS